MSFLEEAAAMIQQHCTKEHVVVVEKSTVPVKSAERWEFFLFMNF